VHATVFIQVPQLSKLAAKYSRDLTKMYLTPGANIINYGLFAVIYGIQ
jgi:hypothetical protein